MTCIIGFVDEATSAVYLAGDSCRGNTSQYTHSRMRSAKVFGCGVYLIGYTSSFRMGQILAHAFDPPDPPDDDRALDGFLATTFVDAVREALRAGGYARKENEVESAGQFLLGVCGRLFNVDTDYQVVEPALAYDAVGGGSQFGLGAMHATYGWDLSPVERLVMGLRAAAEFNAYVLPPYTVARVGKSGKARIISRRS